MSVLAKLDTASSHRNKLTIQQHDLETQIVATNKAYLTKLSG